MGNTRSDDPSDRHRIYREDEHAGNGRTAVQALRKNYIIHYHCGFSFSVASGHII